MSAHSASQAPDKSHSKRIAFNGICSELPNGLINALGSCQLDFRLGVRKRLSTEEMPRSASVLNTLALNGRTITAGGEVWETVSTVSAVPEREGCWEFSISTRNASDFASDSVVVVHLDLKEWGKDSYVFSPSMVYAGNRFECVDVLYSPYWPDASHYGIKKGPNITRQLQLSPAFEPAAIELSSTGIASPTIGWRSRNGLSGILVSEPCNSKGSYGINLIEYAGAESASIQLTTPLARSRVPKIMRFEPADEVVLLMPGESVQLKFRLWLFDTDSIHGLFRHHSLCRCDYGKKQKRHSLPFSIAQEMVAAKLNAYNWDEGLKYYRHGLTKLNTKPFDWWQLGWVSGGITSLPMLASDNPEYQRRAKVNLEFMLGESALPNGLWYAHHDGQKFNYEDPRPPRPGYLVSVRRLSDGLYYALKHLELMRSRGDSIPDKWIASVSNLGKVFASIFEREGQVGQYLDARTATIGIGGSTAGGVLPAALLRLGSFLGTSAYEKTAKALAKQLVEDFVDKGYTNGGPCDALSAPDSESCFALYVSLIELIESDGDSFWKQAAENLLHQYATWVTSYDFEFPAESPLGKVSALSTGSVWANIQNKHASPGICNFSGQHLLRHWRSTGNSLALELLKETAHNFTQYVSTQHAQIGTMGPGMLCERVNLSDWEGKSQIGGNIFGSTIWVETALLLTTLDIPGVYINLGKGVCSVFDNIDAELKSNILTLKNPSDYPAVVNLFCDDEQSRNLNFELAYRTCGIRVTLPAKSSTALTLA